MRFISFARRKLRRWLGKAENTVMEKRESDNRTVNRRYRRAAEQLWENSSLRDELNDEQARRLLDWGSDYLKKAANETAELPDEDADKALEAQAEQVSGVMRQVNNLTRAMSGGDPQEIIERLAALKQNMAELGENASQSPAALEEQLSTGEANSEQVFEALMNLLDGEEE